MTTSSEELRRQLETFSTEQLLSVLSQRIAGSSTIDTRTAGMLKAMYEAAWFKLQKDSDTQTTEPVEIAKSGERAQYWANRIRTQGLAQLSGKFHHEWTINGNQIGRDYSGFREVGTLGDPKLVTPAAGISSSVITADEISGWAYSGGYVISEQERNSANYLATCEIDSNGDIQKKLGLAGQWSSASYLSWADKNNPKLPDHRHHHLPLRFGFLLPTAQMSKLMTEIKTDPDLIETIFQNVYSGLTRSDGLTRVTTQKLRLLEILPGTNYQDHNVQQGIIRNPPQLLFSRPVGETT